MKKRNFIFVFSVIFGVGVIILTFIDQIIYPFFSFLWIQCVLSLYLIIIGIYIIFKPNKLRELIVQCSDSGIKWIGFFIIVIGTLFTLHFLVRLIGQRVMKLMLK